MKSQRKDQPRKKQINEQDEDRIEGEFAESGTSNDEDKEKDQRNQGA